MYRDSPNLTAEVLARIQEQRAALAQDREALRRMQAPRRRAVTAMAVVTALSIVTAGASTFGYAAARGELRREQDALARTRDTAARCDTQLRADHAVAERATKDNDELRAWCGARVLATRAP